MDRIDIHAHAFPETFLRQIAAAFPEDVVILEPDGSLPLFALWSRAPIPAWDVERRLKEMDRDGIDVEVLSAPTVYQRLDARSTRFCRLLNDFQAEIARAHPKRFRSFLHLPVHDLEATRRELERWRSREEVAGVVLASNMGGLYPGHPSLLPVWEWLHESDLAVFIHPIAPPGRFSPIIPVIFDFPCDTATAAATLIYAGILERFPRLRVVLAHYGGALPSLAKRLDMVKHPHFPAALGADLPRLPSDYVRNFYVDTAQGFHRAGFDCAYRVFGVEHMLYGSDHFFHESPWRAQLNAFLDDVPLTRRERTAILRGNAERVFG